MSRLNWMQAPMSVSSELGHIGTIVTEGGRFRIERKLASFRVTDTMDDVYALRLTQDMAKSQAERWFRATPGIEEEG